MPSLSLNVGLNNGRKLPFTGGAAPSGIVVASTASVNIAEEPYIYNSPFTKKLSGYEFPVNVSLYYLVINSGLIYMNSSEDGNGNVLISPGTTFYKDGSPFYTVSIWKMTYFSDDDGSPAAFDLATNPSTNATVIPTSGWSPTLTITAA